VAADFSEARRSMAGQLGAHEVVDPRDEAAFAAWRRTGGLRNLVVFEAIGVPGILDEVLRAAPMYTRVVVVGVCMQPDTIEAAVAINKAISLRFSAGYSPLEFRQALHLIAEGEVNCAPLVTGEVGLEGVDAAFAALGDPERHAKILIDPRSGASAPAPVVA